MVSPDEPGYDKLISTIFDTMAATAEMNAKGWLTPEEVHEYLRRITGREIDKSTTLLPPFYVDYGKNIHIGKGCWIQQGCTFFDRGGITIGDGVFIGPKVNLITINHDPNPDNRNATYGRPIVIEDKVWIGIGVTGPVACGKSTLGRVFLCERPYGGSVRIGGRELSELSPREAASTVGYLGHDPELWNDTVEENVLCGEAGDAMRFLALTALDGEVRAMEQGLQTVVGSGGVRLSGGQAQRLALARTLAHPRPVLVLDDPFSALDRQTEDEVFARPKACAQDRVVILISHRLYHFPQLKQIVFMQGGKAAVGTHEALCASVPAYRALYESQTGGAAHEA